MRAFLITLFIGSSLIVTGCATTSSEPTAHVEQCHVGRDKIVNDAACISEHDKITAERDVKDRERRLSRSADRPSRH